MISDLKEIELKAQSLTTKEKGILIRNLILSIDSKEMDKNVEEQWIKESQRRQNEYKKGKTDGIPFREALKKGRESLK